MAEASIHWKVNLLKEIRDGTGSMSFIPELGTNEREWFLDMQRDGLACGEWGTTGTVEEAIEQNSVIPKGGQSGFHSLSVTEKGKKFVHDYEAREKAIEELKKLDALEILKWSNKQLAEWQSHYTPDQSQWILADQEWKRRAGVSTRRIAISAIAVSILSFLVAVLSYFHSITKSTPEKTPVQPTNQSQLPTPTKK